MSSGAAGAALRGMTAHPLFTLILAAVMGYALFVELPKRVQAARRSAAIKVRPDHLRAGPAGWSVGFFTEQGDKKLWSLAILKDKSVVAADFDSHCIRQFKRRTDGGGQQSMFAGRDNENGFLDGTAGEARFFGPSGVITGENDEVYVADSGNHCIRKIISGRDRREVKILAGSRVAAAVAGAVDGTLDRATFNRPSGIAIGKRPQRTCWNCCWRGSRGKLFVTEYQGHRVRIISKSDVTTLAGSGVAGFLEGKGAAAQFNQPAGIAVNKDDVVFVADTMNHRIRRITNGTVDTLAGSGVEGFRDGAGAVAMFNRPTGLAIDPDTGFILVADCGNHRIRAIEPKTGDVSTIAGSGAQGGNNNVDAAAATFNSPSGIAVDKDGRILVADSENMFIRLITRHA